MPFLRSFPMNSMANAVSDDGMNVIGLIFGITAFLIFIAMALLNERWAGPHQRGDDLGTWHRTKKKRGPVGRA